jgi:hypothetical protein
VVFTGGHVEPSAPDDLRAPRGRRMEDRPPSRRHGDRLLAANSALAEFSNAAGTSPAQLLWPRLVDPPAIEWRVGRQNRTLAKGNT